MYEKNEHAPQVIPGMIAKSASIAPQEVTDEELAKINKFALEPLTAEAVYTFKAVLADTEVDRQYEHFTEKALADMQKLYLGKTVVKDHRHLMDNQVARIYDTELVDTGKKTKSGEPYMQLVAHCYMVKTASNADLIAELKGGIKREGSVGFAASSAICSVCSTDNCKAYCRHYPGRSYDKEGGKQLCTFKLDGVSDAYEFSLVAVPAQRAAGVTKSYTGETVSEKDFPSEPEPTPPNEPEYSEDEIKAHEARLRARIAYVNALHHNKD